jgi:hypothetical protein
MLQPVMGAYAITSESQQLIHYPGIMPATGYLEGKVFGYHEDSFYI